MHKIFSLNRAQYTTVGIVLTIGVIASLLLVQQVLFGVVVLLAHTLYFGLLTGNLLLPKESRGWQTVFGSLVHIAVIGIILSIIYWIAFFSAHIVAVVLCTISALTLSLSLKKKGGLSVSVDVQWKCHWPHAFLFGGYALLFWRLFSRRLGDTLISPWTLFGPKFFFLFFLVTALLIFLSQKKEYRNIHLVFIIVQYLLTTSVALIVYKHGFGFDPFIHHAAESVIKNVGVITPKQPYYIAQYMLTLFTSDIAHLPIHIVDQLLVPLSASLVLPLVIYRSLRDRVKTTTLLPSILLLPILPLSFFTFTTPNNLALVVSTIVFFWIIYESSHASANTRLIGFALSALTCSIHPFIGIPTLLIYIGSLLWKKTLLVMQVLYSIVTIIGLPIILSLNSLRLGQAVSLHNPLTRLEPFLNLFAKPHWYFFHDAPLMWQTLYGYKLAIVPVIISLALVALWERRKGSIDRFFLLSAASIFVSAFLLSTAIEFPSVISYEQGVYGARMLTLSLLLLTPYFVYGIADFLSGIKKYRAQQIILPLAAAVFLTISWYFTYPTRDPVSLYTGYAVRDADVEVVHFIENRNKDNEYIVLANQTISAAAIKELGFFKYHDTAEGLQYAYAVPTGGPLYQFFRHMVYDEPKREWMTEAMDFAGVDRAYFVHTNYWAPAGLLRDNAKKEADKWWEIAGGRAWIYEYNR